MQAEEIVEMQCLVENVRVEASLVSYVLDIAKVTRSSSAIALGASPRAARALYRAAQAFAFLEGYDYVLPRHLKELAVPVLAHRLLLTEGSSGVDRMKQADAILQALLEQVSVPL